MPSPGQTIKPLVKLGREAGDCWQWIGPVGADGYGHKTYCNEIVGAHRWVWMILFGPIPAGMVVSATCGTRGCVNPGHLRVTTQADANRGGVHTVLTPGDVTEIKRAKGSAQAATLAARFGCSPHTIRDIWRGDSWRRGRPNYGPRSARTNRKQGEPQCAL